MRSMGSAALAAMAGTYTDEVFLFLLDVTVDGQLYSFVNNTEAIVRNGRTYYPMAFRITLPSESEEIQTARLTLDVVDQQIIASLRAAVKSPTVSFVLILASDPDAVPEAGPFNFELKDITYNHLSLEATLSYGRHLEGSFPKYYKDPFDFPGLF